MSCTTCLCPSMDNSRSGSSIQSCGLVAAGLGPIPCELLCWWAIFTPDIMLTLLTASAGLRRRHDNFFTPNTFFPRAVCGLWCWSLSRHAPDRGTAGKSVNDVSSFWRGKMSPNIFCGPLYQPWRIFVLQVAGSFSQVSKVRGNKSVSYK